MIAQPVSDIYVVDDEALISESLTLILQQKGFRAQSFTDPIKALEIIRNAPPDLLISDVVMPRLSGVELAILIRELHPGCKILLFSGQASTTDLLNSAHRRGHQFPLLQKPVHPSDLLREIDLLSGLDRTDGEDL